jgi:hypothetical protein
MGGAPDRAKQWGEVMDRSVARAGKHWGRRGLLITTFIGCLLAITPGGIPAAAQDETDEEAPIGNVWGERVPYEYSSVLIEWDGDEGVYRVGEEEGSFALLLSLPEAEGWEFVTILAESWFETPLDDRQAWDVFRWRAVYRRPFEFSDPAAE